MEAFNKLYNRIKAQDYAAKLYVKRLQSSSNVHFAPLAEHVINKRGQCHKNINVSPTNGWKNPELWHINNVMTICNEPDAIFQRLHVISSEAHEMITLYRTHNQPHRRMRLQHTSCITLVQTRGRGQRQPGGGRRSQLTCSQQLTTDKKH